MKLRNLAPPSLSASYLEQAAPACALEPSAAPKRRRSAQAPECVGAPRISPPSRYIANSPRPPLPEGLKPTPIEEQDDARASRYRLQNQAARLLLDMRVAHCCRTIQKRDNPIQIRKRFDVQDVATTRYSFAGLQTCGSVHVCPHCAPYVAKTRQAEVEHLIRYWKEQGLVVLFLTLTHPHTEDMPLRWQLDRLLGTGKRRRGGAIARFTRSKAWRRLDRAGYVRRIEVTRGQRNGWHPHTHWLIAVRTRADGTFDLNAFDALNEAWVHSCENAGLPRPSYNRGFVYEEVGDDAKAMGDYVAKMGTWDVSHEMTLSHLKKGKIKSRSPWQLLRDSFDDKQSSDLFVEYAKATKGVRSLIWSRGLKDECGLDDLTDLEVSQERASVEEVVYSFTDEKPLQKIDDGRAIKGVQKFNMILARGSRLEALKRARSGGGAAVDRYIWDLILEYRAGYEPFDGSDPPVRPLPWTQPAKIRLDS